MSLATGVCTSKGLLQLALFQILSIQYIKLSLTCNQKHYASDKNIISNVEQHFRVKKTYFTMSRFFVQVKFGFSRFTRKRKVLELRVTLQAQINLHIAVILSCVRILCDLQKRRQILRIAQKRAWPCRSRVQIKIIWQYMFLVQIGIIEHLQQSNPLDLLLHAQTLPATRVIVTSIQLQCYLQSTNL